MTQQMMLAMLFPILAVIVIILFAGGLGILFMVLESIMGNEFGVVILGSALVIGVPSVAYSLQRMVEK